MADGLRRYCILAVALCVALLGIPASSSAGTRGRIVRSDWPEFRYHPNHAGFNPAEHSLTASNVASLALAWSTVTDPGYPVGTPVVVGDVVYVALGSNDPSVYAMDAGTGSVLWTASTGSSNAIGDLSFAGGALFVGNLGNEGHGALDAFDAVNGGLKWVSQTGGFVYAAPTAARGLVYVGSRDHHVWAFRTSDGSTAWTFDAGASVDSSPAVAGGVVFAGSGDAGLPGAVYALNAQTGQMIWTRATSSAIYSSPAVVGGVVYVASADGSVYALDAAGGGVQWQRAVGGVGCLGGPSPAVVRRLVFVGTGSGDALYALNRSDGSVVWTTPLPGPVCSSPSVANGVVFVGAGTSVYALSESSGTVLWSYSTSANVYSSPAVSNGMVYVGSNDSELRAFSLPPP